MTERIKRIQPSWEGKYPHFEDMADEPVERTTDSRMAAVAGLAALESVPSRLIEARSVGSSQNAISQIGQISQRHIAYAANLVRSLPKPLVTAAHEPYRARAIIYALLMDQQDRPRQIQLKRLREYADTGVYDLTNKGIPLVDSLDRIVRLPLIDMTIPALSSLSPDQYRSFKQNVTELVQADEQIDVFEWSLQRILLHHIETQFTKVKPLRVHYYALTRFESHCAMLMSVLVHREHRDAEAASRSFATAAVHLKGIRIQLHLIKQCSRAALDQAMDLLALVVPRCKRQILSACAVCISADQEVPANEAELLRAISDGLGCPMPPLVSG